MPTPTLLFSSKGSLSGSPYTVADDEKTSLRHPSCACIHSTRFSVPSMLFLEAEVGGREGGRKGRHLVDEDKTRQYIPPAARGSADC